MTFEQLFAAAVVGVPVVMLLFAIPHWVRIGWWG